MRSKAQDVIDLEDLWQAIRHRHRHTPRIIDRARWTLYRVLYRVFRRALIVGAKGN